MLLLYAERLREGMQLTFNGGKYAGNYTDEKNEQDRENLHPEKKEIAWKNRG